MLNYTINANGQLIDLGTPQVMGILNVTPDSFYSGSRKQTETEIAERVEQILAEGGQMIDIGAYSSRPNADDVSTKEEMERLRRGLRILREKAPDAIVSVDTFRADVAKMCVEEYGVQIVNDISGGELDKEMFPTVARLGVPYVLMHMKGTPQTMQEAPHYDDLMKEVLLYFAEKIQQLRDLGQKDIILDPGFGFGKATVGQPADCSKNFALLNELEKLSVLNLPLLVGVSRKSLIYKTLNCTPEQALNGTTVLNTIALMKGASILRVHDVKAASECCQLFSHLSLPDCPCFSNLE